VNATNATALGGVAAATWAGATNANNITANAALPKTFTNLPSANFAGNLVAATNLQGFALEMVKTDTGGSVTSSVRGTINIGCSESGRYMTASDYGAMNRGRASGNMIASGIGSENAGHVGVGKWTASGHGSVNRGYTDSGGQWTASGHGSVNMGYGQNITNTGHGSMALCDRSSANILITNNAAIVLGAGTSQEDKSLLADVVRARVNFIGNGAGLTGVNATVSGKEFSIVLLPDLQNMTEYYPEIVTNICQWVVSNAVALNIKAVVGLGDIVNTANDSTQWANAKGALDLINNAGIPNINPPGNHDYDAVSTRVLTNYNAKFPLSRYTSSAWYGGSFDGTNAENMWIKTTAEGRKILILGLEFFPRTNVLAWADGVLASNTEYSVIVATHGYLNYDGNRILGSTTYGPTTYGMTDANSGEGVWLNFVKKHPNIVAVVCGHIMANQVAIRNDIGNYANPVAQMLSNYQEKENGGNGYLRLLTFNGIESRVKAQTYSPYADASLTDSTNQFGFGIAAINEQNTVAFRVGGCTNILPNNTVTTLTWPAETFDYGNCFNGTNFVAPCNGIYAFTMRGEAKQIAGTTTFMRFSIQSPGVVLHAIDYRIPPTPPYPYTYASLHSGPVYLTNGATVYCTGRSADVGQTNQMSADIVGSEFSGYLIHRK